VITPGYTACHFVSRECANAARFSVCLSLSVLAVNTLPAPVTPGLQMRAEYALAFFEK